MSASPNPPDYGTEIEILARQALGDRLNRSLSTEEELRFGKNGSISVMIAGPKAGTWHDFENGVGGGVIEFRKQYGIDSDPKPSRKDVIRYPYHDETGEKILFWVCRIGHGKGKRFWQEQPGPDKGGIKRNAKGKPTMEGARRVPYRLPEIVRARQNRNGRPPRIYGFEGEKDVDRVVADWGLVATTNPGGAGKWDDEYSPHLGGCEFVFVADNDDAGRNHAEAVARSVAPHAESVRIVHLSGLPEKGDISDWIDAGGSQSLFEDLVDNTPFWTPSGPDPVPDSETEQQSNPNDRVYIENTFPLPRWLNNKLRYQARSWGEIWIYLRVSLEEVKDENGKTISQEKWEPLCTPFSVETWLRLVDADQAYGLRILVADRQAEPRPVTFERAELARQRASEVKARLFAAGMRFAPGSETAIVNILKQANPENCVDSLSLVGWQRDVFMPPCGDASTTKFVLSDDIRLARDVVYGGSLGGWQSAIATASQLSDTPHWTLGAASGFAGCILQHVGLDTTGINFSGPSSCGKTLAQQLAVSVWTAPGLTAGGLFKPARFTVNSIELLARQSNGLVLGLDELALIDGRTLAQVIYGLAAGVGKARMTIGLKLERQITWATFVLLSCESALKLKVESEGGKWTAGQAARFLDVDCSGVNRAVPQATIAVIKAIERNHGYAGPEFIRRFQARGLHLDRDALRQRIVTKAAEIAQDDPAGPRVRAALPLALISVAGNLAIELDILPPTLDIASATQWAWAEYAQSAGAAALKPEQQAEANLRRWIAERFGVTIKNVDRSANERHNNRDAVAWYDSGAIYIPADRLAEAAGGILSERAIAQTLDARNLLVKSRKDRRTVNYVPSIGEIRAYALNYHDFANAPTYGNQPDEGYP